MKRSSRPKKPSPKSLALFVRDGLGLSSPELARALKCGERTVYNWAEGVPPTGVFAELLTWIQSQLMKPRINGPEWGQRLLAPSARPLRAWLLHLAHPPFEKGRPRGRNAREREKLAAEGWVDVDMDVDAADFDPRIFEDFLAGTSRDAEERAKGGAGKGTKRPKKRPRLLKG